MHEELKREELKSEEHKSEEQKSPERKSKERKSKVPSLVNTYLYIKYIIFWIFIYTVYEHAFLDIQSQKNVSKKCWLFT